MDTKEKILRDFFQIEIHPIERRINDTKGCIWFYTSHTIVLFILTFLTFKTPLLPLHIFVSSIFALFLLPLFIWRIYIKKSNSFSMIFLFECIAFFLGMLQSVYAGIALLYIYQQRLTLAHLITCMVGVIFVITLFILRVRSYKREINKKKRQTIPFVLTSIAIIGVLFGRTLYRYISHRFDLNAGLLGSICCLALSFIWALFSVLQAYNFHVARINRLDLLFKKE